ncbi:hypothetical protein FJV41_33870 [Myxococcus llanfairpwllgwyngyllgogerychwyrndrobwllllantysiliogogogochensis]|uniref:Lipoprotein n=1 Tax=Myxococcus llanfairpwllgwyngyllgogerychwyrndrobwllllantysiliogogogochensis TaxID=2590453 RepID=A0A540WR85_9BACT|nr:hypothetical protein [Myxococcus llanfairpwllgwyngyllgogerychwyrndrobwllllantysiliogogogochensis]TQF11493.1 hypothetical protein FJV41_33870 [Myxococcus llanfairpwllgwyngyllgogerychwyrndrobwllllantysiliogogogochensis]
MNFQRIAAVAVSFACSASLASETLQPPWGKEENLGQKMIMESTSICTDGKGHYVVVSPEEERGGDQLYYGDGKTFFLVPSLPFTSGTSFLEPRFFNKSANPSFRGQDWRVVSEVELDRKAKTCAVRCGEKNIPLNLMEAVPGAEILRKAAYAPNPQQFAPYALLRDTKGNYYFVDKGARTTDQKNYRVFIGPRGALKPQKMTNVISDSEGEIFSTKKGDLRLVLDKAKTSVWIENTKKSLELRQVPVEENLPLIYNDLGVYEGIRLGTPCDDQ